ncbi:MAG: hypothetical protein C0179_04665, partial [Fervidicoccus sp.]
MGGGGKKKMNMRGVYEAEEIERVVIKRIIKTLYDLQDIRLRLELRTKVTKYTLCPNNHLIPLKKEWERRPPERITCPLCGAEAKIVSVESPKIIQESLQLIEEKEKEIRRRLAQFVKDQILYREYLSKIRGVGEVVSAFLITYLDPSRFDKVSGMWKYCGLHVVNGKAPRRIAGQKTDFNPFARVMMWRLGEAFRMQGRSYRYIYELSLQESQEKHPDWSMAHHINHARRVTVKLFLSHFYEVSRALLGLPRRIPYPLIQNR